MVLAAACGTQASHGYPLYPKLGDGPGRDKVALLYGPVQIVDEQNVGGKGIWRDGFWNVIVTRELKSRCGRREV